MTIILKDTPIIRIQITSQPILYLVWVSELMSDIDMKSEQRHRYINSLKISTLFISGRA